MVIFVDIDHTICFTPRDGSGKPNYYGSVPDYENIAKINRHYSNGDTVVYWTARGAEENRCYRELTKTQLKEWGCKYHELRLDKPFYDLFYEDKSLRLPKPNGQKETET